MFAQVLSIVLPVFLMVGVGFVAAKSGVLARSVGEALARYVFVIALPVMMFRTLAGGATHEASPWALWFAYFVAMGICWGGATIIIRKVFKREARAGVIAGMSAAFSNTAMVGIPMVSATYGDAGLVPFFLLLSMHMPVATVVTAVLMENAAVADGVGEKRPLRELILTILKSLVTNPIIIGIFFAMVWRVTGLPLDGIFGKVIDQIKGSMLPVALLSLGMSMVAYGIRGNLGAGILLSVIKVAIMPTLVYLMCAYVVHLPPVWVGALTLTAACPTGVNAFIFATRYGTGHAMSANAITITTGSAVITSGIWVMIVSYLVPA